MKRFIDNLSSISKWYGIGVVLIYAVLIAEYMASINEFYLANGVEITGFIKTFLKIHFGLMILSAFVVWIILSLLFHLTALLFNGKQKFSKFLITASYPYIIPAIFIFMAIMLMNGITVAENVDVTEYLLSNDRFKLILNLVNYSFIPYYIVVACIIRYLYNIKWLYAALSVIIPVVSIWGITELFKLL